MYLTSATRPDILFAASKLRHLTSNLRDDHWCALEQVMHYMVVQWITEFIIPVILQYLWNTVMLIGYLMLMSYMPQVDMFSL
jgi:hypothetical protein